MVKSKQRNESYELWMRVDPPKGHDLVVDLSLEKLDLICHVAVILVPLLLRDYERIYNERAVLFVAGQDSAGLNLPLGVDLRSPYELLHDFNWTKDCPK
jgi:hypothetical protein